MTMKTKRRAPKGGNNSAAVATAPRRKKQKQNGAVPSSATPSTATTLTEEGTRVSTWITLPDDIYGHVWEFLSVPELVHGCMSVCREWHQHITRTNWLWLKCFPERESLDMRAYDCWDTESESREKATMSGMEKFKHRYLTRIDCYGFCESSMLANEKLRASIKRERVRLIYDEEVEGRPDCLDASHLHLYKRIQYQRRSQHKLVFQSFFYSSRTDSVYISTLDSIFRYSVRDGNFDRLFASSILRNVDAKAITDVCEPLNLMCFKIEESNTDIALFDIRNGNLVNYMHRVISMILSSSFGCIVMSYDDPEENIDDDLVIDVEQFYIRQFSLRIYRPWATQKWSIIPIAKHDVSLLREDTEMGDDLTGCHLRLDDDVLFCMLANKIYIYKMDRNKESRECVRLVKDMTIEANVGWKTVQPTARGRTSGDGEELLPNNEIHNIEDDGDDGGDDGEVERTQPRDNDHKELFVTYLHICNGVAYLRVLRMIETTTFEQGYGSWKIYALDLRNEKLLWTRTKHCEGLFARWSHLFPGRLTVTDDHEDVLCLDAKTGKELWTADMDGWSAFVDPDPLGFVYSVSNKFTTCGKDIIVRRFGVEDQIVTCLYDVGNGSMLAGSDVVSHHQEIVVSPSGHFLTIQNATLERKPLGCVIS